MKATALTVVGMLLADRTCERPSHLIYSIKPYIICGTSVQQVACVDVYNSQKK